MDGSGTADLFYKRLRHSVATRTTFRHANNNYGVAVLIVEEKVAVSIAIPNLKTDFKGIDRMENYLD
ncbi:hypothetical protein DGG96_14615 [Legionella qingyii]|uniref:Uncharacterized protein n=1 Tax=Legionella qingyii TaxID=2184757 RepID=A0A317TZ09_9GAMM|nr:hypothetical protein DGG96_14615 [Legionella qingyii]